MCVFTEQASHITGSGKARGKISVSMLPGSPEVLDRRSMTLVPCTPTLCKHDSYMDAAGNTVHINRWDARHSANSWNVWCNRAVHAHVCRYGRIVHASLVDHHPAFLRS